MMFRLVAALLVLLVGAAVADSDAAKKKAVRMKTSRQLKEILSELSIEHGGLDKDGLRELALKEDAVSRWEELHPEQKPKPRWRTPGGSADPDTLNGMEPPEGMDPKEWDRLMAQMRGDFSSEEDPEKRRILEKLKRSGMSFSGGANMDIEQLRNLEKALGGMSFGGGGGAKDEV